ncbi:MAG: uracil-DNA glycosylase [Pseudomonadota bacterium]|nr:uracil-DNA glycosylase [Pseudomonadota bacterium]
MKVKNIKSFIEFYRFLQITTCISQTPRNFKKPISKSFVKKEETAIPKELNKKPYSEKKNSRLECLDKLKKQIKNINCNLKEIATNLVFSDGNPNANIMLMGEAPGAKEDLIGKPFVGEAGQLLDKMLGYIQLNRDNFYISNMVFWRPPGNRTPNNDEISLCIPLARKHISIIKPKLLILVGSIAAKNLLKSKDGITKLRGKEHVYRDDEYNIEIPTRAIFHPAYLLRNPIEKKRTWEDLLEIDNFITKNKIK